MKIMINIKTIKLKKSLFVKKDIKMKTFFNELYLERTITFYSENRAFKIGQRGETIYIVQLTGRVICFVLDLRLSPLATDTL